MKLRLLQLWLLFLAAERAAAAVANRGFVADTSIAHFTLMFAQAEYLLQ